MTITLINLTQQTPQQFNHQQQHKSIPIGDCINVNVNSNKNFIQNATTNNEKQINNEINNNTSKNVKEFEKRRKSDTLTRSRRLRKRFHELVNKFRDPHRNSGQRVYPNGNTATVNVSNELFDTKMVVNIETLQVQLKEIEDILRTNAMKAIQERNEKLETLEIRAEALREETKRFGTMARAIRKRQRLKCQRLLAISGAGASVAGSVMLVITLTLLV